MLSLTIAPYGCTATAELYTLFRRHTLPNLSSLHARKAAFSEGAYLFLFPMNQGKDDKSVIASAQATTAVGGAPGLCTNSSFYSGAVFLGVT